MLQILDKHPLNLKNNLTFDYGSERGTLITPSELTKTPTLHAFPFLLISGKSKSRGKVDEWRSDPVFCRLNRYWSGPTMCYFPNK